jgi:hypothetical protein
MKDLISRLKEPTPAFWKKIQKIGITLGVIGTAIITAPVTLPAVIVSLGSYLVTAGAVAAGLSQLTSTNR